MINGMGVLGRRLFRLIFDNPDLGLTVRRINDWLVTDVAQLAYLIKYDTVYGRWDKHTVDTGTNELIIDSNRIQVTSYSPGSTGQDWHDCDVAIDCTGSKVWDSNATYADGYAEFFHTNSGIQYVVGCGNFNDNGATIVVFGENHTSTPIGPTYVRYSALGDMISATQILEILDSKFGVVSAMVDEITAYQNLNNLKDNAYPAYTDTSQVGRAGAWNIIPTTAAKYKNIFKIRPELNGKLIGDARNVGVITGALSDFFVNTRDSVGKEVDLLSVLKEAITGGGKEDMLAAYNSGSPLISFIKSTAGAIVSSDMVGLPYSILDDAVGVTVLSDTFIRVTLNYDPITLAAANALLTAKYIVENP